MKKLLVFALTASLVGCGAHQKDVDDADPMKYAETITPSDLKDVFTFLQVMNLKVVRPENLDRKKLLNI